MQAVGIIIPLILIIFTCLIIWRACDGFEIASEYIGRNLSDGVRGGSINAISSSLPELFTTLIALFVLRQEDGFSVGIGTTAGSALFNGMIIPAVCILTVVGTVVAGQRVTSVNVSTKVVLRDGLSLIFCNLILVLLINGTTLHWWHGLILMLLYLTYFAFMLGTMSRTASPAPATVDEEDEQEDDIPRGPIAIVFYWLSLGPILDLERMFIHDKHRQQIKSETWNGWPLLITSASVIAAACWLLVEACRWLGSGESNAACPNYDLFGQKLQGLGMPTMFVAVIFASMATSVPDTVMSIRDARDGDYDDAVANALGSNIFDICFALGFPLFLYALIYGSIEMNEEVARQSAELRLLLLLLTIVGFLIYYVGKRITTPEGSRCVTMGRSKAVALLAIYVAFACYIICLGAQMSWATAISEWLEKVLTFFAPTGE